MATQFKAQSQPFFVIAPIVLVGPTCVADTVHGTVSPVGNGQATYTPTGLYHGSDSYSYEVCDANALCSNATVTVEVTPGPGTTKWKTKTIYFLFFSGQLSGRAPSC